ncbi:MAG: PBP1A family penicillin-binding protein [Acidobacteria bacterium]|nr:PBP1A family penicillin-binding protein [Acidobacteriota bacterium]
MKGPDTSSPPPPGRQRVVIRVARRAGLVALFLVAALLGTLSGVLFAYSDDLPQISALDSYQPNTITRLFARDGREIGEFATERRVVIDYDRIAPALRQALIASEDADFEQHFGLSVSRIVITALKDLLYGQRAGASTITQQVARMLFLSDYMRGGVFERSFERKIKEAIVAVQLEKRYTKREIFTFYANHVTMGHGAYGVEAGAQLYFSKPAKDLTLDEAATLAAVVQTPARLSPFVNPDQTLARRNNYVLPRMADEGFVTKAEADQAAARPLELRGQPTPDRSIAPYFVEDIRKVLEQRYGAEALYEAGLRVQTTLDADLQQAANLAIDRGLRRVDKRRSGYRRPARNVVADGRQTDRVTLPRWSQPVRVGDIVPAVVTFVPPRGTSGAARIRIGPHTVTVPPAAYAWTRRSSAADLFRVGDLIEVEVREMREGAPQVVALEQPPELEGALVAIDNRTGEIRAMVGGFSFERSKFNRATQARRQLGSTFKPIVYTTAIDRGFTPVSTFVDAPISLEAGPNQPPYEPMNYDRKFEGTVTLRHALEDSRNIPAVKAMLEVGPQQVVSYAARFGFTGLSPFLSLALGSAEETLLDTTAAYTVFPNQGVRMRPYAVTTIADRDGNILEQNRPDAQEAIRADTAFVMTSLLRGVIQRGTGAAAGALDWPVAGKTGTVDDYTDTWFLGFDPNITVGVWVGYDEKKPIGGASMGETGATAALPIWMEFMRAYIDLRGDRGNPPAFEPPGNIVFVTLGDGATEAFINGTQPQGAAAIPASE